jgi:hypothetical protein
MKNTSDPALSRVQTTLGSIAFGDRGARVTIKAAAIAAVAITLALANSWLAFSLYVLVAIIWLIPARRIERAMS